MCLLKAFTHLTKRLKPLEHYYSSTENEFKDLCYLLTTKSLHDTSFKNWEGVHGGRENLISQFQNMIDFENSEKKGNSRFYKS